MSGREIWEALWQMYPGDMLFLCVAAVVSILGLAVCLPALIGVQLGFGEEEETWLD